MKSAHLVLGVVPLEEPDAGLGDVQRGRRGQVVQPLDVGLEAVAKILQKIEQKLVAKKKRGPLFPLFYSVRHEKCPTNFFPLSDAHHGTWPGKALSENFLY